MKKHIITIAGRPGSGKSATAKAVASKLNLQHFSSGDLFRQLGKDRNTDVLQANLSAEQNAEIDHIVDKKLQEIGKHKNNIVIDSRTAWHWIPDSYRVFLNLDLKVGAQRILSKLDERKNVNENIPQNTQEYVKVLERRLASETRRYKKLYGIDPYKMSNYDLVIDTSNNDLNHVVKIILDSYTAWLEC